MAEIWNFLSGLTGCHRVALKVLPLCSYGLTGSGYVYPVAI